MARRKSGRAHMAWVRSFRKKARVHNPHKRRTARARRRTRRNPYPMAGIALNPRRRHRRTRRLANPRRHSRRRRNPSVTKLLGVTMPPLQAVLWAGVGFVAPSSIETWLNANVVPASLSTSPIGKYAVKIGAVLGLSWAIKQVMGPDAGKMAGIGGGAWVLISAIKDFAPGVLPGTAAYVLPGASGLSAYVPATHKQLAAGGRPVFGASNIRQIPSRFARFTR